MLGVTLFGIFLTPVFYYVIQRVNDFRTSTTPDLEELEAPTAPGHAFSTHVTDTEAADEHADGQVHAEHVHGAHTSTNGNGDGDGDGLRSR